MFTEPFLLSIAQTLCQCQAIAILLIELFILDIAYNETIQYVLFCTVFSEMSYVFSLQVCISTSIA